MEAKGLALYAPYLDKDATLLRTSDTVLNKDGSKVSGGQTSFILTKAGNITTLGGLTATGNLTTSGEISSVGNIKTSGLIGTSGYDPNDIPSGWYGGIRTWDVIASGTIAVLTEGTKTSDKDLMTVISQKGYITTKGRITASGNIETGEYLKFTNAVIAGYACSTVGLVSRDSLGQLLTCKSGVWTPEQPVGIPQPWPSTTPPAGWLVCNGQTFNITAYPLLAKAYPSGKLPDLRGNYIRGLDQGRGYDDESNRAVLSEQKDAFQNHNHRLPTTTGYVAGSNQGDSSMTTIFRDYNDSVFVTPDMDSSNALKNGNNASITNGSVFRTYDANFSGSTPYSDTPRTAKETRTKNTAFVYIVRAL